MSFGGMLAAGIAGGANQVVQQAAGDVEANRRLQLQQQMAQIEEQMRMRLMDRQESLRQQGLVFESNPDGPVAQGKLKIREAEGKQDVAKNVDQARSLIPVTQEALKATEGTRQAITLEQAGNPEFLRAKWNVAMSDPQVKAAYDSAMASAAHSGAATSVLKEQYGQLVEVGNVATKVRGLQQQLQTTTDEDARSKIQQQISDLGFTGKDPTKFLSLAEKAQDNVAGALKVLMDPAADQAAKDAARLQMERAVELSTKAAAAGGIKMSTPAGPPKTAPSLGTVINGFEFKGGDPNDKANWAKAGAGKSGAAAAAPAAPLDMKGITFAGDGYTVDGTDKSFPTLEEARAARDKAKLDNNPMSRMLNKFGD